jgi:hypothetical protein
MEPERDTLTSLVSRVRLRWVPFPFPFWSFGLVAALTLGKLLLYVLAAQPFGGAEAGLCQWDCEWYIHTIQSGYDKEPLLRPNMDFANWAFFPLYPLLAGVLKLATGLSAFWAGTATSVLCFISFVLLSTRYRALTRGLQTQARDLSWIVLLTVYPFSFYFFVPYTESLYLLTTVLLLLAVRTNRPTGTGLATALLTATRPTGVLVIPYIVLERAWHARLAFLGPGLNLPTRSRVLADCAFPLVLAPLGLACYMAYLYWLTGDALAFSHVQIAWDRRFFNPLKTFYWSLAKNDWFYLLDVNKPQSHAYAASFVVVAGLVCLWLLWRGLFLETWLLGATVLLALTTSVESIPRYVTASPVFLFAVGDLVDCVRLRVIRIGLAVLALLLQILLLRVWFGNSGLLM